MGLFSGRNRFFQFRSFPFFSLSEQPVSGKGSKTFLTVYDGEKNSRMMLPGHCNGFHGSIPLPVRTLIPEHISSRPEAVYVGETVASFFPLATELLLFFYANIIGSDVTAPPDGKGNKQ